MLINTVSRESQWLLLHVCEELAERSNGEGSEATLWCVYIINCGACDHSFRVHRSEEIGEGEGDEKKKEKKKRVKPFRCTWPCR